MGLPRDFYGCEKDIMIVSSFRNSVDESLGAFTRPEDGELDVQLLRNVLSRSKKFLWFVGSMDTLESTNDRILRSLTAFLSSSNSTSRRFEAQDGWKKTNISRVLFTETAIKNSQMSGVGSSSRPGSKLKDNNQFTQNKSASTRFHEERKTAER